MPRKKYLPKNRYCHNSNLSEQEFSIVLWCWIQCASAPQTVDFAINDSQGGFRISGKTISRYYKKFGDFLFSKTIEKAWMVMMGPLKQIKGDMPQDAYEKVMDEMAELVVFASDESVDYNAFRILVEDIPFANITGNDVVELQKIRSARKVLRAPCVVIWRWPNLEHTYLKLRNPG